MDVEGGGEVGEVGGEVEGVKLRSCQFFGPGIRCDFDRQDGIGVDIRDSAKERTYPSPPYPMVQQRHIRFIP